MGKTKQQLIADNNASFPNNNANYITPALLRDFNRDMIDNTVNQDVYTADSASFNQRIGDLASWSSSLDTNFASQAEFNSYTSSNNAKVNALIAATASFATSAITASSLTTASFAGGTMTFTKGDGSTFGVVIPDVSGSTLPAGTISGSAQISSLGFVSSSVTASSLTTASFSGNTLTFTKGNGTTFGVTIPDVSGSTFNTGSFATTGSNTFYGDEIISGNLDVRDNIYAAYIDMKNASNGNGGSIFFRASGSNVITGSSEFWSLNPIFQDGDLAIVVQPSNEKAISFGLKDGYTKFWKGLRLESGFDGWDIGNTPLIISSSFGGQTQILDVKGNVSASNLNLSGALTASILEGYALVGGVGNVSKLVATSSFGGGTTINTGSFATTGSNAFVGNQTISGSLDISGSLTSSLQQGYVLVGNSNNRTSLVATSSFGGGTTINTGSFATTGSNNFIGVESISGVTGSAQGEVYLLGYSGSLVIGNVSSTPTYAALGHISSSAINTNTNLIFKTNNNTATTIVSGSNNIFTNTGNPTAGFRRYLTSGNISMMGALPQISASMAFSPTITNNSFINAQATANPITIRGPISSSAYTINSNQIFNQINLGSSAANNAEKIVAGISLTSNIIQTLSIVANRTNTTQNVSISNNQLQGTTTLNMNSSSIDLSNNLWAGTNTITNNSSGSSRVSAAGNAVGLYQNILLGTNTITFSGSNDPNDVQDLDYQGGVYRSIIIGTNTPFVQTGPTGSNSITNTAIIGNGLIVTGSSGNPAFGNDSLRHGSVFVGRFNDVSGNKDLTAETIFAVGTGTSTSNRKTGFLIDSGSNTFVEGTLNVSGSTTMTGSLILSSSAATELIVIGNSEFTGSVKVASTFQLQLPTGSNQQAGTAVLDGANPGTVTVSNSLVTANSIIMVSKQTLAHSNGYVAVSSKGAGTFTITSNHNGDTDTVGWFIINNS